MNVHCVTKAVCGKRDAMFGPRVPSPIRLFAGRPAVTCLNWQRTVTPLWTQQTSLFFFSRNPEESKLRR